jgi:hypothetical protein
LGYLLEANARKRQLKVFVLGVLERGRQKKWADFVEGEKKWVNWEIGQRKRRV